MDFIKTYRQIIRDVLTPYTQIPYSYGDVQCKTVL